MDGGRKPLGFSLEVEGFGFNDEELEVDDCAETVVVVPNNEPYGLTTNDAAGLPGMADIRCSHAVRGV